jgi:hypothetical protein
MPSLTGFKEDRVGVYIEKDPFAILDYTLDFNNWLPAGDTIDSVTITAQSISGDAAPLVIESTSHTTLLATADVSGGTVGNIYNVEYRIITANGLRDSRNIRIKIAERQVGI